jgi:hypothetical protein
MPKYHINGEEFAALNDERKKDYREIPNKPGTYRMILDDDPVGEFRETNTRLMQQLTQVTERAATAEAAKTAQDEILAKYRDEDGNPLDADEIKRVRQALAEKGGKKGATVDEALTAALKPLQTQVATLQKALEDQKTQTETERKNAKRARLQSVLMSRIDKVLVPGASPLVVRDMLDDFDIDDADTPMPKKNDAEGNPITEQRYLDALRQRSPGLFRQSTSGEEKDNGGARITQRADGVRELHNPTSIEMGQHADDIAKGKIKVVRTR